MIVSIFTVTLIAFFVLTVWFEQPAEPVRRPEPKPANVEDPDELKRAG